MGIFFGTDGVRGIVNNDLTEELAQMVGNALSRKKKHAKILIGRDTRVSGSFLTAAFATGALKGGANVIDVGVVPTAAISYLVKLKKLDYGVMISASHNPREYNGIKIFDGSGQKLSEKQESELERFFACQQLASSIKVGKFKTMPSLANHYAKFLLSCAKPLSGLKIVLDCANGASYKLAPKIFKALGATVIKTHAKGQGKNINENCGSTSIASLQKKMCLEKVDVGFAFDGDADRVIAVDENAQVLDGDQLIYILAKHFSEKGMLSSNTVVGTSHTNTGLVLALSKAGINMIRTDIGDKYVIEAMEKMSLSLGGEQSGHIIIRPFLPTGDGILAALQIASIMKEKKKKLSELFDAPLFAQINKSICVDDKLKVLNNENLSQKIASISAALAPTGRILVRASGTEPKIRVMIEHLDLGKAEGYVEELEKLIKSI